ncbi:MAG: hypothetical protein ACRDCH_02415 [Metamycoplasmataceae bacterium]
MNVTHWQKSIALLKDNTERKYYNTDNSSEYDNGQNINVNDTK